MFHSTITEWTTRGWTFEALDGVVGKQGAVGRRAFDQDNARPSESVVIYFRRGLLLGMVHWADYADLPNFDEALAIAYLVDAQIQRVAVPPVAPPPLRYDPRGPDRDCGDFATHAEAQAFYEAAGGPAQDPHRLDSDRNGVACEALH